jgi:hypothetical protein
VTKLTERNCSSLTVHFTHELAYEALLVAQVLSIDIFPARQHGIPLLVNRQLNFGGRILLFSILLTVNAGTDPWKGLVLAYFS